MNARPLDCGHEPTITEGSIGVGYAETKSGQRLCYPCTDALIRGQMDTERKIVAYANGNLTQIITWSGGLLARVTKVGALNRRTGRRAVWATDAQGRLWHGQAAPGEYLTLRRAVVYQG